jgi:hypothetical protein
MSAHTLRSFFFACMLVAVMGALLMVIAQSRERLFVGGGSALLEPYLRERFPEAEFAPNPQMANARGLYKSECYLPEEA